MFSGWTIESGTLNPFDTDAIHVTVNMGFSDVTVQANFELDLNPEVPSIQGFGLALLGLMMTGCGVMLLDRRRRSVRT